MGTLSSWNKLKLYGTQQHLEEYQGLLAWCRSGCWKDSIFLLGGLSCSFCLSPTELLPPEQHLASCAILQEFNWKTKSVKPRLSRRPFLNPPLASSPGGLSFCRGSWTPVLPCAAVDITQAHCREQRKGHCRNQRLGGASKATPQFHQPVQLLCYQSSGEGNQAWISNFNGEVKSSACAGGSLRL